MKLVYQILTTSIWALRKDLSGWPFTNPLARNEEECVNLCLLIIIHKILLFLIYTHTNTHLWCPGRVEAGGMPVDLGLGCMEGWVFPKYPYWTLKTWNTRWHGKKTHPLFRMKVCVIVSWTMTGFTVLQTLLMCVMLVL